MEGLRRFPPSARRSLVQTVVLLGQCALVWLIALWIALGVIENLRNPAVNRALVADVLAMKRMRELQPEAFAAFGRNRIENPAVARAAFALIVAAELVAAALLVAGAALLSLALAGLADPVTARATAALGAVAFTAIWGAFLVGGQWVHYWCGYEGSQMTHFALTIWGGVTFVALVAA
jgi:ABC-type Fe3+-siderophore transport system permease subunit